GYLVGEPLHVGGRIGVRDAEQDEQPLLNLTDDLSFHRDARPRDALHHRPHGFLVWARIPILSRRQRLDRIGILSHEFRNSIPGQPVIPQRFGALRRLQWREKEGRMAEKDYTPYQQKIIKRYYDNQGTLQRQRLADLVAELYLAEGKKKER